MKSSSAQGYSNFKKATNFFLDNVDENDKCDAHRESDKRAEAFNKGVNEFFGKGIVGKFIAGFIVKPEEEKVTPPPGSVAEKINKAEGIFNKVGVFLYNTPQLALNTIKRPDKAIGAVLKMGVDAAQFTVRNTVKQPIMALFRAGALLNNAARCAFAKDNETAAEEWRNVKYQAGKFGQAVVATALIAAVDVAIVGTGGLAVPVGGIGGVAIANIALTAHATSLAQGGIEVAAGAVGIEGTNFNRSGHTQDRARLRSSGITGAAKVGKAVSDTLNVVSNAPAAASKSMRKLFTSDKYAAIRRSSSQESHAISNSPPQRGSSYQR